MRFTAQQRLDLIDSVKKKEKSVSEVCREAKISRKTFYKWLKRFEQAPIGQKVEALRDKEWKLSRHGRKLNTEAEKAVLDTVAEDVSSGYGSIQRKVFERFGLSLSKHAIQNILQRYLLDDPDLKVLFRKNRKISGIAAQDRLLAFEATLKEGRSVAQVCRNLGISRKTYYKWLKRYQKTNKFDLSTFEDRAWEISRHPRRIPTSVKNQIVSLVAEKYIDKYFLLLHLYLLHL